MRRSVLVGMLLGAVCVGLLIAWVDSRPTWDDTGITVGVLLLACAGFGAVRPGYAWLWALAIGAWIPLAGILFAGNYGTLLALAIAFIGAYAGALARRILLPEAGPASR